MYASRSLFAPLALSAVLTHAAVTVYNPTGQGPMNGGTETASSGTATATAAAANYTGSAAYDPTVLKPPPFPDPLPNMTFPIQLYSSGMQGLSIPIPGSFYGFSIEMSVTNQVLGKNGTHVHPPFLNLMANIAARAGRVHVRVGGNTQETAQLVETLHDGKVLEKDYENTHSTTQTPPLLYTPEILYMMSNISSFVNVEWYVGIPFKRAQENYLEIAKRAQQILGQKLLGIQAGNEPDLYQRHGHRPEGYSPYDFWGEWKDLLEDMQGPEHERNRQILIGPSIATGDWTPEMVWDTGFLDSYVNNMYAVTVEHYPDANCFAQFGVGSPRDPQVVFFNYLNHGSGQNLVRPYLNSSALAIQHGKPFIMFETNTASCGGFPGVSDSFGAALWALDYGLQMAYGNFSEALLHVGGQNVYYNPFTSPPTNQSTFRQWTIGPVYYSALIMAEVLGKSDKSRVVDLFANSANEVTPAYAIYEDETPTKVALFNYITDPTGGLAYTAQIQVGGGTSNQPPASPRQIKVKYFTADSVSQKGNFMWGNQTFGDHFASDGRLMGEVRLETVDCNDNICNVRVPAPSFALVFLTDEAVKESAAEVTASTFATTAQTRLRNTATVGLDVLETSNGHSGKTRKLGSTSHGSNAAWSMAVPAISVLLSIAAGGVALVFARY